MTAQKSLRILVAEDSSDDFDLLVRALVRAGYEVDARRVDTARAMKSALAEHSWDVVFSDWSMPSFSAMDALAVVHEAEMDVPFVIVSGTIGEETAVEALRAGAHDFLVKDRLARLAPAVERELREAETRRERNRMREQLMISDRMASIGLMAAGVAHEINNPLAAVIANVELALADFESLVAGWGESAQTEELRGELSDARSAAQRVTKIVRDLKVFSRSESELPGAIDLRGVLESTLRMIANEIKHRARVATDFGDVPLVHASEARLGQLFLNLLVNAAQAIPEGRADRNEIRVTTDVVENRARVTISDTGSGIPPEVMRHLFTPFVTTKPPGQGTGLGLSICHRIVTELKGEITVETREAVGTTFVVWLPLSASQVPTSRLLKVTDTKPARRGSILVIDDEEMLTNALKRLLERDHEVVCTQRARDAIDRIQAGQRFDVIISDLMMPEVTGMDLHAELLALDPGQAEAIVFLTGGAFTTQARNFLESVPNQRLEKPFDPNALRAIINQRLR